MTDKNSLMDFPCDFQIKIIGPNNEIFIKEMIAITRKHYCETKDSAIVSKTSQNNNFVAITITIYVKDQISLDALYTELSKHPDTKMVL
jgi:uncharacterized protein